MQSWNNSTVVLLQLINGLWAVGGGGQALYIAIDAFFFKKVGYKLKTIVGNQVARNPYGTSKF